MNKLTNFVPAVSTYGISKFNSITMFILHVDDDEDDREMFLAAVEATELPITCLQFDSCQEVIDFLKHAEELPDFLFIDINMPKMNGLECVQYIRTLSLKQPIKMVMHSTSFSPVHQETFSTIGIQCLLKTSRFSELVESIKAILSEQVKV